MIGETVGNFEIISRLGKGGMGEVWLAEQKSVKTKVAIKMLQPSVSTNTTHVQRFFQEAVAVSQIHHAGIVKIFDVGTHTGGQAYLVMEYLQGETLTSRIQRIGRLPIEQVAEFGRQTASVLDATHGAGITHRDLKPDNIYLVRDAELPGGERVKILDFGIAKLEVRADNGPRMTSLSISSIGTPNYMSPEQWHSLAEVDWRTDAYAFGCVAFEMACGRPPFQGESMSDICSQHLSDPPPVPSRLVPGLPPQFDELVARLLEKEPAQRPTMRDAMNAFTVLGQPYAVAVATLPPGSQRSPFAAPSQSQPSMPQAGGSQSFAAPGGTNAPAGFASATVGPAPIAPAPTVVHPAPWKKPRRGGLFVVLGMLAIAGTVGAVALSTTSSGSGSADSAGSAAPGSANAAPPVVAAVVPDAAVVILDAAIAAVTVDAELVAAIEPDAAVIEPVVEDAGVVQVAAVDAGVKPANAVRTPRVPPTAPALPGSLTQQQMDAGLVKPRKLIAKNCQPEQPIEGTLRMQVVIRADGTVASVHAVSPRDDSPFASHSLCIGNALRAAVFPATKQGGTIVTSFKYKDRGQSPRDDDPVYNDPNQPPPNPDGSRY